MKILTNRPQSAMKQANNRPVAGKAQGNKGNTNTGRVISAIKSSAVKATSGGKFKKFLGQ